MPLACSNCPGADIETDDTGGKICTGCGEILEAVNIVSSVDFHEGAGGIASAVGQFVDQNGVVGSMSQGMRLGERKSRQANLNNGRQLIHKICTQLDIHKPVEDLSFGIFERAVSYGMTRGRPLINTVAACVYYGCRKSEKPPPIMLLDISDAVQVNVYELGRIFQALRGRIFQTPAVSSVEPLHFLASFCSKLEFGSCLESVCSTAYRLVQRMKRDYMLDGRRPAGLCGAAILFAARIHNFNRTEQDIIRVVKVCEGTVRKRMKEFANTASSGLTVNEFEMQRIELEEAEDPPSFQESRRKAKEQERLDSYVASGALDTVSKKIEEAIESSSMKKAHRLEPEGNRKQSDKDALNQFISDDVIGSTLGRLGEAAIPAAMLVSSSSAAPVATAVEAEGPSPAAVALGLVPACSLLTATPTTGEGGKLSKVAAWLADGRRFEEKPDDPEGKIDTTDFSDGEIDDFILSRKEIVQKSKAWWRLNADYFRIQKEKAEKRAEEEKNNLGKPVRKKRQRKKVLHTEHASASEAMEKMLQEKKFSNKIDYTILKSLDLHSSTTLSAPYSTPGEDPLAAPSLAAAEEDEPTEKRPKIDMLPDTPTPVLRHLTSPTTISKPISIPTSISIPTPTEIPTEIPEKVVSIGEVIPLEEVSGGKLGREVEAEEEEEEDQCGPVGEAAADGYNEWDCEGEDDADDEY